MNSIILFSELIYEQPQFFIGIPYVLEDLFAHQFYTLFIRRFICPSVFQVSVDKLLKTKLLECLWKICKY